MQNYLMKNTSSGIVHLIKLINATNSVVGQNQSASLQNQLSRFWIFRDISRQTDG